MPNYAVYVMSKSETAVVSALAFLAGGVTALLFYGNLFMRDGMPTLATHISNLVFFVLLGYLAIKFVVPMYRKNRLEKRRTVLKRQFRDMLESLAASFSSGSNVDGAFKSALKDLQMQYSGKDYIVREMQEIVDGRAQNIDLEVMLRSFGDRSGNDDILSFVDIFTVCQRKGGNINLVVHRTHSAISDKMSVADEIETKLTSNKMQHNVMSVMPIVIVAMLRFTNESFAANFATLTGVLVNTVAIGIFVGAYIYGNKIVEIKG